MKAEELKREFAEKWGWVTPTVLTHDYRDILIKQLNALIEKVIEERMPTEEEIDQEIDRYAFRVPYDGTNNFYDEVALKHYKAGIEWHRIRMKGGEK